MENRWRSKPGYSSDAELVSRDLQAPRLRPSELVPSQVGVEKVVSWRHFYFCIRRFVVHSWLHGNPLACLQSLRYCTPGMTRYVWGGRSKCFFPALKS